MKSQFSRCSIIIELFWIFEKNSISNYLSKYHKINILNNSLSLNSIFTYYHTFFYVISLKMLKKIINFKRDVTIFYLSFMLKFKVDAKKTSKVLNIMLWVEWWNSLVTFQCNFYKLFESILKLENEGIIPVG